MYLSESQRGKKEIDFSSFGNDSVKPKMILHVLMILLPEVYLDITRTTYHSNKMKSINNDGQTICRTGVMLL